MSSIVVSPEHRVENTIYLVFSVVIVIFSLYMVEWVQGKPTGLEFQPNPLMILVTSTFIATTLMYVKTDESFIHNRLMKRALSKDNVTENFILLSIFSLRTYILPAVRIRSPKKNFNNAKITVLEGGDLDADIWKLRGALWITLSIPFSISIAAFVFQWQPVLSGTVVAVGVLAIVIILRSARKSYIATAKTLVSLAEFHWFDKSLTAIRRSEITVDSDTSSLSISVEGLSESLYRAIVGAQTPSDDSASVPIIVKPERKEPSGRLTHKESPIHLSGSITGITSTARLMRRRIHELLSAECDWLRELVRRNNWASFSSRLENLKASIYHSATSDFGQIPSILIGCWLDSMKAGRVSNKFTNFRNLCHLIDECGLLVPYYLEDVELVRTLLLYRESHMVSRHWAFQYYLDKMTRNDLLESIFYFVAEYVLEKDYDTWGPPDAGIPVETLVQNLEYDHLQRTGNKLKVFESVPEEDIESPKTQDYPKLNDE